MKTPLNYAGILRIAADWLVLAAAYLLAYEFISMRYGVPFDTLTVQILFIDMLVWLVVGFYLHLYDDFRSRPFSFEFVAILKTLLLNTGILTFVFFYGYKYFPYSRTFVFIYTANIFIGMTIAKFLVKKFMLKIWSHGYNSKNILIVGTGEAGLNFHQTITQNDHFGYRCIGFVDDHSHPSLNGNYLGRLSEIEHILDAHEIDEVVVALSDQSKEQTESIILASEKATKRVKIIASFYQHCTSTVSMSLFGPFPLITIRSSPLDEPRHQLIKRVFDICFTLVLLITFSWLFVLIALLIKLTSPGPVIYKQERWGLKKSRLTCYKFRTMRSDAAASEGGAFAATMPGDPRVTRLGSFLRRTSLDELPQFINVLKGDMSFVGPRPHATLMHLELKDTIQHYMLRHLVKPGITGWAQVNGCRGENHKAGQMQRRINFDLWYIENYSFWLDCQIISQTLVNLVKGDKNAY
ncbi:undecaprenyl-phosphate glucose phosphotransferase [Chitinophaga sp. 22321]|uniref:Undecaprenyl-phosphate glucose phosphotransferase n=1 Tax=Chitinophaga hostae TaxID=2831022 RepID=A0ABS5J6F7_9BACT|nr:undecaprenyl-phosphate glucose phosphotransferase [Chitinophaga hostae]MBS0030804.1 undecaprenyl-phosphate glucose phosphotransferase [Chitinophaga hostae]